MRTNRETSTWLKEITAQSLTMRENLEQAIVFFDGFTGDHRTFLQKQRKMKKEAQERLMEMWEGQENTMVLHQVTIVRLWKDLDLFRKNICVKSVMTGS